jgi:hypothetical protein
LSLQIETLNRALDILDGQIKANLQEIIEVRIPEASSSVSKTIEKKNVLLRTGAATISFGRTFREISRHWQTTSLTYPNIMTTVAGQFSAAAYAFSRLIRLEDAKNLGCDLGNLYKVLRSNQFRDLMSLNRIYEFLARTSSPYFVTNPVQYLSVVTIPKVLQMKTLLLNIELKDQLSCLIQTKVDASSDLIRAIDNWTSTITRRLEMTEKIIVLIDKRNRLSEPRNFLWFQP